MQHYTAVQLRTPQFECSCKLVLWVPFGNVLSPVLIIFNPPVLGSAEPKFC
jgi:hypothetical protein